MNSGDTPRSDQAEIVLRPFESRNDYEQCVKLQLDTWGHDFTECVPVSILQISQKVGGVAVGAFDADEQLIGFVYGISGLRDGRPAHWSHMLAVRDDLRDQGIGRRLKLYQRDRLLEIGVERVFWTFEPLVARNAHLNLNRLGAQVNEYVQDMYGDPMGKTETVIGTDRLVVSWHIAAERRFPKPIPASLSGPIVTADVAQHGSSAPSPELPDVDEVRVEIPQDIQSLKDQSPDAGRAWRVTTRRALVHYLARGYSVRGLAQDADAGRYFYALHR